MNRIFKRQDTILPEPTTIPISTSSAVPLPTSESSSASISTVVVTVTVAPTASSTPTAPSTQPLEANTSSGVSIAIITGIVFGVLLLVFGIAAWIFIKRNKQRERQKWTFDSPFQRSNSRIERLNSQKSTGSKFHTPLSDLSPYILQNESVQYHPNFYSDQYNYPTAVVHDQNGNPVAILHSQLYQDSPIQPPEAVHKIPRKPVTEIEPFSGGMFVTNPETQMETIPEEFEINLEALQRLSSVPNLPEK